MNDEAPSPDAQLFLLLQAFHTLRRTLTGRGKRAVGDELESWRSYVDAVELILRAT